MKSINFARIVRALAILALLLVFPGKLENAGSDIYAVFFLEVILILAVIFMTNVIDHEKNERKPQRF